MENEFFADWTTGTGLIIAACLVALWYIGRPLLKVLGIIGRFFARIAGAIKRFLQPIYEFLYRAIYILIHIGIALFLGFIALLPVISGDRMSLVNHMEAGAGALIILGLTWIIFRHFLKYPLRSGKAQTAGDALRNVEDQDAEAEEIDLDIDL